MPAPVRLSAGLYLIGTTLLLPGTVLLLPMASPDGSAAISFLLAACSALTVAAVLDLSDASRSRGGGGGGGGGGDLAVPVCMLAGGVLFLTGSALYWPAWAALPVASSSSSSSWTVGRVGTWVFRTGTCAYLAGSFFSIARRPRGSGVDLGLAGVVSYVVGALLYFVGGVASEAGAPVPGSWLWAVGSGWFVLGALLFVMATGSGSSSDGGSSSSGGGENGVAESSAESKPLLSDGAVNNAARL